MGSSSAMYLLGFLICAVGLLIRPRRPCPTSSPFATRHMRHSRRARAADRVCFENSPPAAAHLRDTPGRPFGSVLLIRTGALRVARWAQSPLGRVLPERPADCSRNPKPEASNAPASRTVRQWELARAP